MNNPKEIIIKYLDRQLSDSERREFEILLETDKELSVEFENYKKVNQLFSDTHNPVLNNDYFNNIIPEFRKKLEKKDNTAFYRKYGMAFTALFLMLTSFFIGEKLFVNQNLVNENVQSIVEDFSEDELNQLADYFSSGNHGLISDSEGIGLLNETELSLETITSNISSEEKISIIAEYNLNEVYSYLDSDLLEAAYNEILSKRIF
jgi:hypothetical protein